MQLVSFSFNQFYQTLRLNWHLTIFIVMCYVDRALSLSLTQTVRATGGDSSVIVTVSQLEGFAFDPRPLSESPQRSLGNSVHLNRPDKKQISDCGLPPTPVTKIKLKLAHCTRKNAD